MINRRAFLARSSAAAASFVWLPPVTRSQSRGTYFDWQPIAEGARAAYGGGGAAVVISSDGESLLIDCKGYGLGRTLRREVEVDGNALVAAVNSHHHSAQSGGNVAFTPDITLIAQRNAGPHILRAIDGALEALQQDTDGELIARRRAQIFEQAFSDQGGADAVDDFDAHVATIDSIGPANFGPTAVFADRHDVPVGALTVELHHFGRAHTDNDLVAWVPALGLMHVGNLVYLGAHPVIDTLRGGDTRSWQRVLQRAHDLGGPEARLIPSDGNLVATGHDIEVQIDYFDQIRELAQRAIDAGMTRQQTVDFIPTTRMGRFASLANPDRLPINLGIVYDEITGGREAGSA